MVDMKSKRKYKFTDEFVTYRGHTLRRIIAISDFGDVKAGDIGGFIETGYNLSREGTAWVGDNAYVFAGGRVAGDALVSDTAQVYDNARVCDDVK